MLQSLDSLKWQSLAVTFLVQITAGVGWIFLLKSYVWVYILVFKSMRWTD